jgi:hypothetical protein
VVIVLEGDINPTVNPSVQIEVLVHVKHRLDSSVVEGNPEVENVSVGIKNFGSRVDGFRPSVTNFPNLTSTPPVEGIGIWTLSHSLLQVSANLRAVMKNKERKLIFPKGFSLSSGF